jgi:capsular polysaccharide biosynthesis protein
MHSTPKRWLRLAALPLVAALIAAAAAALSSRRIEPVYRATATVVLAPSSQLRDPTTALRALETLERRSILATLARIPGTTAVRTEVGEALGLAPSELRAYAIRGSVLPHASVLAIEVLGPAPERAAQVANAAADALRVHTRRLYPVFSLRELEGARPPGLPVRPDVRRDSAVAALLGLFVGALAVAAWTALRAARASA